MGSESISEARREWIRIARFDLYPNTDEPVGYVVGFGFSANQRSGYTDVIVPLNQTTGKTPDEIVDIAILSVATGIRTKMATFRSKSPLIGREISLPEEPKEPEEPEPKG